MGFSGKGDQENNLWLLHYEVPLQRKHDDEGEEQACNGESIQDGAESLLKHLLAKPNRNKQRRRKPWIRYERRYSLSMVQMTWHVSGVNGKQVCIALDDASRKVLAGGEFDQATAGNSVGLVRQVLKSYGYLRRPDQVLTDHGTQFTASKRNAEGDAGHVFEDFLRGEGIAHVM